MPERSRSKPHWSMLFSFSYISPEFALGIVTAYDQLLSHRNPRLRNINATTSPVEIYPSSELCGSILPTGIKECPRGAVHTNSIASEST